MKKNFLKGLIRRTPPEMPVNVIKEYEMPKSNKAPAKAPVKAAPAKAAPVKKTPAKAPVKASPVKKTPAKVPAKAAPVKKTPAKAPAKAAPAKAAPVKKTTAKAPAKAPAKSAPVKKTTAKAPVKAAPVKKTPAKAAPAKAAPVKKTPAKAPAKAAPAKAAPIKKAPAKAPAKAAPVKKTPAKAPVKAAPVKKVSPVKKLAVENPVDEIAVALSDGSPVVEQPASTTTTPVRGKPVKAFNPHSPFNNPAVLASSFRRPDRVRTVTPTAVAPVTRKPKVRALTPAQVAKLRKRLDDDIARLNRDLALVTEQQQALTLEISDPAVRNARIADGASAEVEFAQLELLRDNSVVQLDEIEDALEAFDDGSYGTCKKCGEYIPFQRLELRPFSLRCVKCA